MDVPTQGPYRGRDVLYRPKLLQGHALQTHHVTAFLVSGRAVLLSPSP